MADGPTAIRQRPTTRTDFFTRNERKHDEAHRNPCLLYTSDAIQKANQENGGSVLELGEAEYMVRASGYLQSLDDFRKIPLLTTDAGVSVRLGDVARVQVGPEMRRGIAEFDGEGEVAGGVIVMRTGKNALETIDAVKAKLKSCLLYTSRCV